MSPGKIRPSGVVLGCLALMHTLNELFMGLFDLYMDHGKASTTALDFINHNRVPFIVIHEPWKNQTQRSCTWVSSSDAHPKRTVYRMLFKDPPKLKTTALDEARHVFGISWSWSAICRKKLTPALLQLPTRSSDVVLADQETVSRTRIRVNPMQIHQFRS